MVCGRHQLLGWINCPKGDVEKMINHLTTAIEIASSINCREEEFWALHSLASLLIAAGISRYVRIHVDRAKPLVVNDAHLLGRVMHLQA